MRGRRLWCKVPAHGSMVRCYVQKGQLHDDDGNDCDAFYDPENNTIVVQWRPDFNWMKGRLFHELFHVYSEHATGDSVKGVLNGSSPEARHDHEERIVGFWSPGMYAILTDARWLRIPNPPGMKGE